MGRKIVILDQVKLDEDDFYLTSLAPGIIERACNNREGTHNESSTIVIDLMIGEYPNEPITDMQVVELLNSQYPSNNNGNSVADKVEDRLADIYSDVEGKVNTYDKNHLIKELLNKGMNISECSLLKDKSLVVVLED